MANFESYIPLLLQVEGGYQDNPKDLGNFNSLGQLVGTQRGISARFYEGVINRPPTVNDMKAISKSLATSLYKTYFWNKLRANEIVNQNVANTVVDHHVNAGDGAALAQEVLNTRFNKNLAVDNGIGNLTLSGINSVDPFQFVTSYNQAREQHYRSLSNSPTFLDGWLIRLQKFAFDNVLQIEPKSAIKIGTVATVIAIALGLYYYNQD